ncbi:helix-turn-helix transcriptional regulator [Paraburkholderia sp. GAS206C]|jgi:DNA-binding CsgD family transcriptional regulator|uniref:helix-turn-helix transcriptional regulator n=1 Tax=unclassified Paraburkholderia TaxID=2615204 RepID=UPI003D1CBCEA
MKRTADEAIAALYTAAVDPNQWDSALSTLTTLADARAANCFVHDALSGSFLEYRFTGYGSNWAHAYAGHYHGLDLARGVLLAKPVGTMYPMHRYIPDSAVQRSEYYQDFYMREGLRYSCGGTLLEGGQRLILAVHRPVGHRPYEEAIVGELQRVLSHLPNVFRVRNLATKTADHALISGAALDALPRAAIIVDAELNVHYLNRAAETVLRTSTAVNVQMNRLTLNGQRLAQQLTHRVKRACLKVPEIEVTALYVHEESDGPTIEISVVPLKPQLAAGLGRTQPLAMVLLRRPFHNTGWPDSATRPFALSRAEMAVAAAIAAGLTPGEYAASRGVQISTVRSQIKSILQKTGTRRITDIAMLFAAIDIPASGG